MVRRGTYSIVGRDRATGELGVAVQSHWFAVGPIVPWVRGGVGAVATQSIASPAYGPRLLDRLSAGESVRAALDELLAADELARFRQVAAISAAGEVATHTGTACVGFAGHEAGPDFSVQANMMSSPDVWPAMASAFASAHGPLARRLLAALKAAEGAGGDARGRQSSALVVADADAEPWQIAVNVRVDDHHDPLGELERLLDLSDAYELATEGDHLSGQGRHAEAGERYRKASALAPANHELLFWSGLASATAGDMDGAVAQVQAAIEMQPGWYELLGRLQPELAPSAQAVRAALDGV